VFRRFDKKRPIGNDIVGLKGVNVAQRQADDLWLEPADDLGQFRERVLGDR
jgi:hypothetical protein